MKSWATVMDPSARILIPSSHRFIHSRTDISSDVQRDDILKCVWTGQRTKHSTENKQSDLKNQNYHLNSFLHLEASATHVMFTSAWHHTNVTFKTFLTLTAMQWASNTINFSSIAGFQTTLSSAFGTYYQNAIDKTEEILLLTHCWVPWWSTWNNTLSWEHLCQAAFIWLILWQKKSRQFNRHYYAMILPELI